ncbi:MAG TPA: hypothetical protein VGC21_21590 [Telluria sp.]
MRLKFTYIEAAPADAHLELQEDVSQFFQSVKSRSKTTAEEGDALLERSLPTLAAYGKGVPLRAEHVNMFLGARDGAGVQAPVRKIIHNTLHEYEQRYMRSALGGTPGAGKSGFSILKQEFDAKFSYRGLAMSPLDPPVPNAYGVTANAGAILLGKLFVADSRFIAIDTGEPGLQAAIFVDREEPGGKQYIQLPDNTFTKRYVKRGLSGYDGMRLTAHQPLIPSFNSPARAVEEARPARHGPGLAPLTTSQQVLSHTRGWKKRMISTGVSERKVYSTRGTQFMNLFGSAVIDLAKLTNQLNILDVHRSDVATAHLGNPDDLVVHGSELVGPGVTELEKQKYLGLRDVVRTRELLIKGSIDYAAVRAQSASKSVVGVSVGTQGTKTTLHAWLNTNLAYLAPSIIDHESHEFRDVNTGRFWVFIAFNNAALAQMFQHTRKAPNNPAGTLLPADAQLVLFDVFAPN